MSKKYEIILNQTKYISFRYEGKCDNNIFDLIDLGYAFFNEEENQNNNLFVKVGEYQKETNHKQLINKYVNVPYGYYIVICDYQTSNDKEKLIYVDKIKVLKPETFLSKYQVLEEIEEPTLFDSLNNNGKELKDENVVVIDDVTLFDSLNNNGKELKDENVVVIDDVASIEKNAKLIKKKRKEKGIKKAFDEVLRKKEAEA